MWAYLHCFKPNYRTPSRTPPKYRYSRDDSLAQIDAQQWDRLTDHHPLLRHAFLHALHETGCANEASGWLPQYLTVWDGATLIGAMPLYLKSHSYGEYVFDWAWAEAYQRHGLDYFPKLLSAIPFSPCTGARLLARDDATKALLLEAALLLARESDVSSLHVLLPHGKDQAHFIDQGMMPRQSVQFHWRNADYENFDAFLATFSHDKRKKIKQERRKVTDAGVRFRAIEGKDITPDLWKFWVRCYNHTYRMHHSTPYLNLKFFERIGATMPENIVLFLGEILDFPPNSLPEEAYKQALSEHVTLENRMIGASLCIHNGETLYGRYWGVEPTAAFVPGLHFEACYYQAIDYCIAQKIKVFEGGAQGAHKLARGLLPVACHSAHWLKHPQFAKAVEDFLVRERDGVNGYIDELNEHSPFKTLT
jgi:uncharacterized protein